MSSSDAAGSTEALRGILFENDLDHLDPEVRRLIDLEDERQVRKIILVASESIAPRAVRQALQTSFTNIYGEGYPSTRMIRSRERPLFTYDHHLSFFRRYYDRRYYKGCDYVNFVEALCQQRAAALFATDRFEGPGPKVKPEEIHANVQPLSGAAANNAVYEAFLEPGDTVMGMSLVSGGHLTHGSPVNRSGKRYRVVSYTVNRATGRLDYGEIRKLALEHRPRMIIAGYSAYPWAIDWAAFREIADEIGNGCILLADISHPAGLVVAGAFPSPIGLADVTMTTTHKTLCGPRGALLLTTDPEKARAVDMAVFPGEQGGPHFNTILAKAVAFKIGLTPEFQELQHRIKENAAYLAERLRERGLKLAYGGTDSHLFLIDLKPLKGIQGYGLRGEVASRILDLCGITLNKNTIAGDTNAAHPTGIRIGTTWITQRGFGKPELDRLAELIHEVLTRAVPFHYIGPSTDLGRARIDFRVMERVKGAVQELLQGVQPAFPDTYPPYPHYSLPCSRRVGSALEEEIRAAGAQMEERDGRSFPRAFEGEEAESAWAREHAVLAELSQWPLVEVRGERAENFLHDVLTCNVRAMQPGTCRNAFMLDKEGRLFSAVTLLREEREAGRFDTFRLSLHTDRGEDALAWLRGLADGYVLFDEADVYRKVEGPVIVESLRTSAQPEARRVRLALLGPEAEGILRELIPETAGIEAGRFMDVDCGGTLLRVLRPEAFFQVGGYEIQLHPRQAPGLWKEILLGRGGRKVKPMGMAALRRLLEEEDGREEPVPAAALLERRPEAFDLTKPFFVGRKTLPEAEPLPTYTERTEELPLRRTPLHGRHLELGAKEFMVPFAGWEMPVWYTRVSDEHRAVRTTAGLFDVAHMGVLDVRGPAAERFLDLACSNYIVRMEVNQAQYNYLLDPDGKVIDDLMVYRLGREEFQVVCNAVNAERVMDWLQAVNSGAVQIDRKNRGARIEQAVEIRNLKDPSAGADGRIDLALQGPASLPTLCALAADACTRARLRMLPKSRLMRAELAGIPVIVSRTGYTGEEYGYELFVHPGEAVRFWNAMLEAGEPLGVRPAGLGARDSTRTEAGLPLYGHELAGPFDVDPIEAGYGGFVKFHKPFFIGRDPLLDRWLHPRKKTIVRFRVTTRNPRNIRTGDPVVDRSGRYVGNVTSCVLVEGKLKGMALVDSKLSANGSKIAVFPLPPGGRVPPAVAWDKMKPGDRLILNERAVVLPRFPMR